MFLWRNKKNIMRYPLYLEIWSFSFSWLYFWASIRSKSPAQTVLMFRLIWAFVDGIWHKGPFSTLNIMLLQISFMQLLLKILSGMVNSVDPDQTAPWGAVWSGSALFAYVILSDTGVRNFRIFILLLWWKKSALSGAMKLFSYCLIDLLLMNFVMFLVKLHCAVLSESSQWEISNEILHWWNCLDTFHW